MAEPLTYSVEEAAKVLGVGRASTYELIHTGQLPHIRIGRRMLISRTALRELLGLPPDENAPAQSQGKVEDRNKEDGAQEMTYLITIRRVANSTQQPRLEI